MKDVTPKNSIARINLRGALLVFPVKNAEEPASLWSEFYPRSPMNWNWDDNNNDNRVFRLWHLMKKLSATGEVVYSKWYQGRATFFSKELFEAMLCLHFHARSPLRRGLSRISQDLLDILESGSPISTKELKKHAELKGKENEAAYARGLKTLFSRLLIVAYGEVDDGAFPSLAVGATAELYRDLWLRAEDLDLAMAQTRIDQSMPAGTKFRKFFDKSLN